MNNVVIGWNPEENIEKWDAFSGMLEKVFLSVRTEDFKTDKEHIRFAYNVDEAEPLIKDCSLLLCTEELAGTSIGTGTLKRWKELNPGIRVIAILDMSRKGGGKCQGFYEHGFFDCVFNADFSVKELLNRIMNPRTKAEAFLYYALDAYRAEERKKKQIAEEKPDKQAEGKATGPEQAERVSEGAEDAPKKKRRRKRKKKSAEAIDTSVTEAAKQNTNKSAVKTAGHEPVKIAPKKTAPKEVIKAPYGGAEDMQSEIPFPAAEQAYDDSVADYGEDTMPPQESGDYGEGSYEEAYEEEAYGEEAYGEEAYGDPSAQNALSFDNDDGLTLPEGGAEIGDVFKATDDEIFEYLRECEKLSRSYVRPQRILSRVDSMVEDLLRYYTVENSSWIINLENGTSTREEFEAEVWQRLGMYADDLNVDEARQVMSEFLRFMWGYDFLEPYILDPNITDIKIYEPQVIMVTVEGENMVIPDTFRSDLHYRNFVIRLAARNHVDIQKNAINRFTDTTSYEETRLRVNISTELINSSGFSLVHIRKVNNIKYTVSQLIEKKTATPRTFAYLIKRIREGASILVCGENASGKTTLTNTLIEFLGLSIPGLFIQESDEAFSNTHPLLQFQQIASDKEFMGDDTVGKKYTLAELAKNGLLTKIQFFGIGEMKGEETAYAHTAIDTGSQFIGTTHTSSYKAALMRLVRLAMMSEDMKAFTKEDLLRSFCQINLIIFMEDFQITQLAEVRGYDDNKHEVIYDEVPITIPYKEHRDKSLLKTYSMEEEEYIEGTGEFLPEQSQNGVKIV